MPVILTSTQLQQIFQSDTSVCPVTRYNAYQDGSLLTSYADPTNMLLLKNENDVSNSYVQAVQTETYHQTIYVQAQTSGAVKSS